VSLLAGGESSAAASLGASGRHLDGTTGGGARAQGGLNPWEISRIQQMGVR